MCGFAFGLFGRHVGGRAEDLAVHRHRHFARFAAGQAEVHEVRLAVAVDHDVGRLQVAMDDALLVGMVQRVGDLGAQLGRFAAGELLAGEPVAQRDAADEVADDVDDVAIAADFVDADDAGVAELGGGAGFAEEFFLFLGRHAAVPRDFDGHRAVELLVAGLPHAAEAADAEPFDQLEAAQLVVSDGAIRVALLWSTRLKWLPQALQVRSVSVVSTATSRRLDGSSGSGLREHHEALPGGRNRRWPRRRTVPPPLLEKSTRAAQPPTWDEQR